MVRFKHTTVIITIVAGGRAMRTRHFGQAHTLRKREGDPGTAGARIPYPEDDSRNAFERKG
jgi:hypothetical protein